MAFNSLTYKQGCIFESGSAKWIGGTHDKYFYTNDRDTATKMTFEEAKEFVTWLPRYSTWYFDSDGVKFHFFDKMNKL